MKRIMISSVFYGLICFWGCIAFGAEINVPADYPTIQAGIEAAENGDTVLVADGIYTGTGNKNIELQGKTITVKSLNGPENCVIDCENSGRGFYIHQSEGRDTVVSGFTIKNGNAGDYGGAIYCTYGGNYSSPPTIDNCIIKNNTALYGGGIGCVYLGATITNCQIINNTSSYGGGIYSLFTLRATDNLVVVNCIISGNNANNEGGGIIYVGLLTAGAYFALTNSSIVGNTAPIGGGIYLADCTDTNITNTILWENTPGNILVSNCSPNITYSDVQGGYTGTGNIEEYPLFLDIVDPNPENWNLRFQLNSPCIDSGDDITPDLPTNDLDNKPRRIDGNGDYTAVVDIGAYEYGDICECDYLKDFDTDGADLADYISDPGNHEISVLAEDFGRANCPNYQYTP